jgi:hypothetical protein
MKYCLGIGAYDILTGEFCRSRLLIPSVNSIHGLSPRANYTDRAAAACQRS